MRRALVAVVVIGALTFSVYVVTTGTVAEQTAWLADGGRTANRVATCGVRFDSDEARNAGTRQYERARVPVSLVVLSDAGRDIHLPPMPRRTRDAVEVVEWSDCALDPCSSFPAVCARWGTARPWVVVSRTGRCLRRNLDAGFVACYTRDGGDPGDWNVYPAASLTGTCEAVEARWPHCSVVAGENPEEVL